MSYYNGTPSVRIWRVGTTRILGVSESRFKLRGFANLPQKIESELSLHTDLFGDFVLCPFTPDETGVMRLVCIDSAWQQECHRRCHWAPYLGHRIMRTEPDSRKQRQIAWAISLAALLPALTSGCLTTQVHSAASEPRYDFIRIKKAVSASLTNDDLFVEFKGMYGKSRETTLLVVPLPLSLAQDQPRSEALYPYEVDDIPIYHWDAEALRSPECLPPEAVSLPVDVVKTNDRRAVVTRYEASASTPRVLDLVFSPAGVCGMVGRTLNTNTPRCTRS